VALLPALRAWACAPILVPSRAGFPSTAVRSRHVHLNLDCFIAYLDYRGPEVSQGRPTPSAGSAIRGVRRLFSRACVPTPQLVGNQYGLRAAERSTSGSCRARRTRAQILPQAIGNLPPRYLWRRVQVSPSTFSIPARATALLQSNRLTERAGHPVNDRG
jgi:hypothetical protein